MPSYSNSDLACAVFGHNLIKTGDDSKQLTCKTCQCSMPVEGFDSLNSIPIPNHRLRRALQELFLLEHRFHRNFLTA